MFFLFRVKVISQVLIVINKFNKISALLVLWARLKLGFCNSVGDQGISCC